MTINCSRCGAELPDDARFCIECGAPVAAAATGPTRKLGAGAPCAACGAVSPAGAIFCVRCGQSLAAPRPVVAPRPAAPPPLLLGPATRPAQSGMRQFPIWALALIGLGLFMLAARVPLLAFVALVFIVSAMRAWLMGRPWASGTGGWWLLLLGLLLMANPRLFVFWPLLLVVFIAIRLIEHMMSQRGP